MGWNDEPLPPERKSSASRWLIVVLIAAAAALIGLTMRQPPLPPAQLEPVGPRHPAVGTVVRQIALQPLVNTENAIQSADLQGKVVLLNFWGTWCPPCQVEFPHIAALAKSLEKEADFRFLSVSVTSRGGDEQRAKEPSEKFLKQGGYTFPVYSDQQAATRLHLMEVTQVGDNFGYPATVVLDRQGTIRGFWVGYVPGWEQEITQVVKAELKK